jgi:ABC-type bacteriocin/lantibiotic exporter with double-glycine peptidase domain
MTSEPNSASPGDPGLAALAMLLHFQGIGADPEQLRHRFGGASVGVSEMLRCAKELGLKARAINSTWPRLAATALPGIAVLRDGGFLPVGKVRDDKALVQEPLSPRPALMTRAELEAVWDGRLVLFTRRAGLVELTRRFDISWFLGAIRKYRHALGKVLVASFFLQLFALISPLFFQVIIDKVLVHRSLSTLDVLVVGLVGIALFETILGIVRTYLFAHTTNRIDVELGARLFRHLLALPIAYFQGGASAIRPRAYANSRIFASSALTSHYRSLFYLRVPGRDVYLLALPHIHRTWIFPVLHFDLRCGHAPFPAPPRREVRARRGEPGISRRERLRGRNAQGAAKLAGAHEFILELPKGYDSIVGERGGSLSGGQRQRLAIARALVMDPRILIFDEATSALDYESERIIQDNMAQIGRGRTVFLIAHRLSTVRRADRIITIDRGRVVEDGAHEELIKTGGR